MPLVIDLHHDLTYYNQTGGIGQTSFERLQDVAKLFFGSVFIEPSLGTALIQDAERIGKDIRWYRDLATQTGGSFAVVENKKDLSWLLSDDAHRGVLIHIEGASMITSESEHLLDAWYDAGLRSFGPLWNKDNAIGIAAASDRPTEGLTAFGKRVIRRASKLGMMIDCAHLNEAGFYDVLDIAGSHALVTHGNARALCPHPRNFTDKQIKDIADVGGIIGIFFSGKYVRDDGHPTIDDVVAHIDHIVDLVGTKPITFGTDFGGITTTLVPGLEKLEDLSHLHEKLIEKGYSQTDAEDIFRKNAERYLANVLE